MTAAALGSTTAEQELAALRQMVRVLDRLDPPAQMRAMVWLEARYPDGVTADGSDHYANT